jgi:DNA-binding PadR family transcriptional regulator
MANEKKMDQVILGLLSHEPLTGYEIKKRIDTMLKCFWSGSYGSIYPTLSVLVQDGFVTKNETVENGRDKNIYTITEAGRLNLKEWLAAPVTKDELRYETLLKLFFGSVAGTEISLEHIVNFEQKIKSELPLLQGAVKTLEAIKEDDTHKYYMLTAMFGVRVYQAFLEWCDEAKQVLEEE